MNTRVFKKSPVASLFSGLLPIVFTLVIIGFVFAGLRQAEDASRDEGVRLLEEALLRVAIHSYAVEGYFPESLDYITEYYGVYIDKTRFIVHYDVFAANLLPDIRVFKLP